MPHFVSLLIVSSIAWSTGIFPNEFSDDYWTEKDPCIYDLCTSGISIGRFDILA